MRQLLVFVTCVLFLIHAPITQATEQVYSGAQLPLPRQADYAFHFPLNSGLPCEGREGYITVFGVKKDALQPHLDAIFAYWVDGSPKAEKPFGVVLWLTQEKVRLYWDADRDGRSDEIFLGAFDEAVDAFAAKHGLEFCENVGHLK